MKPEKKYECVVAASNFYTKGKIYTPYEKDGKVYMKGDDGMEDETKNLISSFKLYTPNLLLLENKE
jgi:hypothetical protein